MYIVIYNKITKRIIRVIPQSNLNKYRSYGYSDNCAEILMDHKPEGKYLK